MTLTFLERLRPRRDPPPLVFEGLAQVRAYWEGLREGDALPQRAALDPRGMSGVLDRIFLAERIGRGLAQLRIAGSGLADFAGMDVRGLPLSCLFTPESRLLLAQSIESVFDTPAIAEIDLASDRQGGRSLLARLILLPLADQGGRKLVLGAISFAAGAKACKVQIMARREERLSPAAVPLAEAPAPQPIRRVGHLALVHSSA
ncbi:MAG: PAS domain-containing protein [Tabrizicola sp.]|uniref:PAS domain-containing protein n=1 Tax=Tabrizicola sp. TaxID=2005166 RepID=UPI003BB1BBE9|nr:PAS domain-containing protein [Tabrizicola sp.]